MSGKKITRRFGTGCCPKCRNAGFDYVSAEDWRKDNDAPVKCPACGWTGLMRDMAIIPEPDPAAD